VPSRVVPWHGRVGRGTSDSEGLGRCGLSGRRGVVRRGLSVWCGQEGCGVSVPVRSGSSGGCDVEGQVGVVRGGKSRGLARSGMS